MNWYKTAQQQLLFYPYGVEPSQSSQKVRPISIDPETKQNIYKCHRCGGMMLEEDTHWYRDVEGEGESLQLPQYNKERISQALVEIAQYLTPFYNQLQEYILKAKLESKRNETYDYGFQSALDGWEVQIPGLINIINKYPELIDICAFRNFGYTAKGTVCGLIRGPSEINGNTLNSLSGFIQNPEKKMEEFMPYSGKEFNITYQVPVCEDCWEDFIICDMCDNVITPDMRKWETTYGDDRFICDGCIENGDADICMSCEKADIREDMHYMEDQGGAICSDCYEEGTTKRVQWAENAISKLDIPVGKNYPISRKVLDNLDNFLNRYVNKYGNNPINSKEWGRIMHLTKKSGLPEGSIEYLHFIEGNFDDSNNVLDIVGGVEDNIDAQDYIKEQYPQLSSYKDLPFDIDVVENYSRERQGFTVTITPSETFFNYAEKKYPNVRSVWHTMRNTPHHHGSLAYARCAYEGGNSLVINNLQRDADYDNYISNAGKSKSTSNKTAKWIDNMTKHWDVFLLNLIKAMAMSEDISAFLTTYDQQKSKWGRIPIHKSKKTYREVPEQMGFPLKDPGEAEHLTELGRGGEMYQVANDIRTNWYKTAQQFAPIQIISYDGYGQLSISFNGSKKYIYPNISPYIYEKIRSLLYRKNYKTVEKMLRNLSPNK